MNRPKIPDLADVRKLTLEARQVIPPEWEDQNGHVNVQYYLRLYETGSYRIFCPYGIDETWFVPHDAGMFDFANHLRYHAEVMVGDHVSMYTRLLAKNDKRFHGVYFIVNDSRDQLACTIEYLTACVSLATRRTGPFCPELNQAIDAMLNEHLSLPWDYEACGAIEI